MPDVTASAQCSIEASDREIIEAVLRELGPLIRKGTLEENDLP